MPFFRAIIFLPQVLPMVAIGIIWRWMYEPDGLVNQGLAAIGLGEFAHAWLGRPRLGARRRRSCWHLGPHRGLCMTLFFAGMYKIDTDLYDAVSLDGGGRFRQFVGVTLPGLSREIRVALTLTIIAALASFDLVYVTTNGSPANLTVARAAGLPTGVQLRPDRRRLCARGGAHGAGARRAPARRPARLEGEGRDHGIPRPADGSPRHWPLPAARTLRPHRARALRKHHRECVQPMFALIKGLQLPDPFTFESFVTVWTTASFGRLLLTSLTVAAGVVPLAAVVSILAGYAISHLQVVGGKFFLGLFVFGLVLPTELTVIPLYFNMRSIGLTDYPGRRDPRGGGGVHPVRRVLDARQLRGASPRS